MRHIRLPAPILRAASPVVQSWWKIRKPKTYGVKVLLRHPDGERFLVVRHSYADTKRWGLPGGGYKPTRETPQQAAAREIREELGIQAKALSPLAAHSSTLEGKHDALTILVASASNDALALSPEIAEAQWITEISELGDSPTSRWLRIAKEAIDGSCG